ncbi:DUF1460 domain-containing protein [Pseudomonas chlororaphis]|uniref:DUF1460 domain-containing protein n=1 Tax=Pseudomonas chlororaphis TaxID=587753 RepID=UPI00240865CB|nr:DUF1460 domain-containing protein [Pseudomonas chlororaphis]
MLSGGCSFSGAGTEDYIPYDTLKTKQAAGIVLDPYTLSKVNAIIQVRATSNPVDAYQAINMISGAFLGTPYRANMLDGSESTPEKLVIDFRGLDCFTYLDYVEALRKSNSQSEFVSNVIRGRYVDSNVDFLSRKHFFTDWGHGGDYKLADDITSQISSNAENIEKKLNEKTDGTFYLPGLPVIKRNITYIPSGLIDEEVIGRLRSGDLIGIYTNLAGLDVTHVGFFISTERGHVLRHASSQKENERVVDSPFMEYVAKTPGIVVLRARDSL